MIGGYVRKLALSMSGARSGLEGVYLCLLTMFNVKFLIGLVFSAGTCIGDDTSIQSQASILRCASERVNWGHAINQTRA